jgi:hypothetical protein
MSEYHRFLELYPNYHAGAVDLFYPIDWRMDIYVHIFNEVKCCIVDNYKDL